MQIKEKAIRNVLLKVYDRKIESRAVVFTSGFSREIANGGKAIAVGQLIELHIIMKISRK